MHCHASNAGGHNRPFNPPGDANTVYASDNHALKAQLEWHQKCDKFLKEEEERRGKKVFEELEMMCIGQEAKKSLWEVSQIRFHPL